MHTLIYALGAVAFVGLVCVIAWAAAVLLMPTKPGIHPGQRVRVGREQ